MISEQRDSNPRPTAPKAAALAKLRYAPKCCTQFIPELLSRSQQHFCLSSQNAIRKVRMEEPNDGFERAIPLEVSA